uniref:Salicylate/benzoate carboxyl methyltransferase n=1 Tax=Noccaea caerulescens TaxID=107243 RepID=A0A1J3HUL4_NOCCA
MSSSRDSIMNTFSMNGGDGENSYANNSAHQKNVISETQLVMVESIREMLVDLGFPEYIKVADLGCSSGPNTFLAMSGMVNTIIDAYQQKGRTNSVRPEIDCFLNDLSENDFNTTFKWLPSFHDGLKSDLKGRCFVSVTPGSFYSRLFPRKSLHFVYSSYSVHWLSKVPRGLKEDDNKRSVYINSSSPRNVYESYLDQFQTDFSLFLRMRSEEIMPNGRMILAFIGRNASDPLFRDCFNPCQLLSDSLLDLVSEGLVKESEVDAFNMPFYDPNEGEVKEVVEREGSFEINMIETLEFVNHFPTSENVVDESSDQFKHWQKIANGVRCITESILVPHFGEAIMDRLFHRYAVHAAKHFTVSIRPPTTSVNLVVSLTRK